MHTNNQISANEPSTGANPAHFSWSSKDDILTLDPHAQNHQTTLALLTEVYEGLVKWNKEFGLEPALALSWERLSPLRWRFHLREGVRFHEGQPFTADDVVFSMQRLAGPTSDLRSYVRGIVAVERVHDHAVDLVTAQPNPVLLRQLVDARIMSRAWAREAGCEQAQDFASGATTAASTRANGSGALRVAQWQPGHTLELKANEHWWGQRRTGAPRRVTYLPIADAQARAGAALRGEIDLAMDLTHCEAGKCVAAGELEVIGGAENRTVFIGFNLRQQRLDGGSANPLADVRVRRALRMAIDVDDLCRTVMEGAVQPAGALVPPLVHGWSDALDSREPCDLDGARRLLREAGYAQGFPLLLDCPENRYAYDVVLARALAVQWSQLGIDVQVAAMPFEAFIRKLLSRQSEAHLFGWGTTTFDAFYTLSELFRSDGDQGEATGASYNVSGYADETLDALLAEAGVEFDEARRLELLQAALQRIKDQCVVLPIYHQMRPWLVSKKWDFLFRPNGRPISAWMGERDERR